MLTSLGFAALLGILGTFVAVLCAGVITLAGGPGSALMRAGTRYGTAALVTAGTVLAAVVETYLLRAFAGATSRFVSEFLEPRPDLPGWPLWMMAGTWQRHRCFSAAGTHPARRRVTNDYPRGRVRREPTPPEYHLTIDAEATYHTQHDRNSRSPRPWTGSATRAWRYLRY